MKLRVRNYYCPLCDITVKRLSDKKWIKSMCSKSNNVITRLMLKSYYKSKTNNK